MVEQKITAVMIIEVAGRPPEYLINSLKIHLDKLNHIPGVQVISSKIAEPRLIEEEKDLYTCFGEVEVKTIGLIKLMDLVFDFMPSSIEIIDPMDLELNCQEATMFMNDLTGRLHKYDEIAKIARMQIQQLTQKIQSSQPSQVAPKQTSPFQPIRITMDNQKQDLSQKPKLSQKKVKSKKKK